MSFEDWIEMVEDGAITGSGLMTASLDFRGALRKAFEAGYESGKTAAEDDAWGEDIR